ncbi:MAG: nucleotidyltransferase family protein [Desulfovibrionaceae bacterium]
MKDWSKTLIGPEAPIIEALRIISKGALQIALVVDEDKRLMGTVTDGDVRAWLLEGKSLQEPASAIMTTSPIVASVEDSEAEMLRLMRAKDILQIPVVDAQGRLAGLRLLKEMVRVAERENFVVLMAGGLGSRLGPLTENCPKPLLKVGSKPILETILTNFVNQGFQNFYISVNYMAEAFENHFRDGSRWGAKVGYLREDKRLGTAGALSLLPAPPDSPFFVMNGDILTNIDFRRLLEFHEASGAEATMCVREYEQQIPYGVIRSLDGRLVGIEEKPTTTYHVNAGIYMLNASCLDCIPEGEFFDMTDLFSKLIALGRKAMIFPVTDYWIDIGRMEDLKRAHGEYCDNFMNGGV